MSLLTLEHLNVSINNQEIVRDLSLSLTAGKMLAILGANGIGKTTLLHSLSGLRPVSNGRIFYGDELLSTLTPRQRAQRSGVLLQQQNDWFPSTVLETVLMGRHPHINTWQWESQHDIDFAQTQLQILDLQRYSHTLVTQLSGGERQRLAIATLLTQAPQLMFLDEPCNHLDLNHQIRAMSLFEQLCQSQQRSAVMVLHDPHLADRYCHEVLLLFGNGDYLHGPAYALLNEENLSRLYAHPVRIIEDQLGRAFIPH